MQSTGKESSNIKDQAADVIGAERDYLDLKERRGSGLAFSGGGIRSASFGLGVMQALVKHRQLEKMDYMSTVSGGGYIGSALTWALHKGGNDVGTSPEKFPLGIRGKYARPTGSKNAVQDKNPNLNNSFLDFMRQHSSYLMPTRDLGILSFGAVVLRSMLLSLLVYFSVLVILLCSFRMFGFLHMKGYPPLLSGGLISEISSGIFIPVSIGLFAVYVLLSLGYSLRTFLSGKYEWASTYLAFVFGQTFIGYLWKVSLACLLVGLLPFTVNCLRNIIDEAAAGGISTLFGTITGLWQYRKAQKNNQSSGPISDTVIYLGAFALVYGLLLLAFSASGIFFTFTHDFNGKVIDEKFSHLAGFIVCILLTLVFGLFVNINLIGPHRIWRNRLMEAFMPDDDARRNNVWKPAKEADGAMMHAMCSTNRKPYHIVNTNIILSHSDKVTYNGRGGDNFIISPLFSGSDATSWVPTKEFNQAAGGITLATAMATSAAALNPNAAVSGEGVTRNTVVSIMLSILNLRLGYWAINPKNKTKFPPNFFNPGLGAEILRFGFKEEDKRILLSDGGHFENLAIYELVRRKLELIILSDGGADPAFNFDDLANAVEKVRVDFGATIIFREKWGLDNILPGTKAVSEFDKKYAIGQRGFAVADIYYNNGTKGVLVYIKLAMIEGLPTDIYSYKGVNPSFPHQSTADQFFDEKQFEAYRELGYQITNGIFEIPEVSEVFGGMEMRV